MLEILGFIDRLTYVNPENQFTVAKFQEKGKSSLFPIVGYLPEVEPGETLRIWGDWVQDKQFGKQFKVERYQQELPTDIEGIERYLASGLIKGVGAAYAKKIVKIFGLETLKIIEEKPEKLSQVPGMGKKRIEAIRIGWEKQRAIHNIMFFLQSHSLSPTYAQKIYRHYGENCLRIVQQNPFRLASEIRGIGFKLADKIAHSLKIPYDSSDRIDAGFAYFLSELSGEGHVCYPVQEFIEYTSAQLNIDTSILRTRLKELSEDKKLHLQSIEGVDYVWSYPLYYSETGIAQEIIRLQQARSLIREIHIENALKWVEDQLKLKLAKHQKIAVAASFQNKFHIITGGPGTGKSTIINAILRIAEKLTKRIVLAAPTGRAAKRMTEITHKSASTIHSLLEFDVAKGRFKKGLDNPIKCDLIIIDEASMIDTYLMHALLRAIPSSSKVILVGDTDQLPSVGPGNVLKDLIESETIETSFLKFIFRQSKGSKISYNAHLINQGYFPNLKSEKDSDFFFMEEDDPEKLVSTLVNIVHKRLPETYGLDPIYDIQVLSPMKKGLIGIENLNHILQKTLNPQHISLQRGTQRYCRGDKVMQIRNNPQKGISNGDLGIIITIDQIAHEMFVDFDGKIVTYDFSELDEIVLAYAASIHKYQGSESKCVVIPIHTQHFKLLHRNLLYTGITRAKKLVVLIGTKKALAIAVKNDEVKRRYTGLKSFLKAIQIASFSKL